MHAQHASPVSRSRVVDGMLFEDAALLTTASSRSESIDGEVDGSLSATMGCPR